RAAGVARVDAGVGLDQALVGHVLVQADVALQGADDADADGVLVAVGVADGDDGLADHQVGGGAQRHHGQGPADVDLEQGQVHFGVARDDLGVGGGAVAQPDAQQADVLDDVLVGDDVPARVDEDAGAHAVDAVGRGGAGVQVGGGYGALAVDV